MSSSAPSPAQIKAFGQDMRDLYNRFKKEFVADPKYQEKELRHLRLVEASWAAAIVIGCLAAPLCVNPITIFCLSYAVFVRFTCIGHAVLHGGYNHVGKQGLRRGSFAQGGTWRRIRDWLDWLEPNGWICEHNKLHHYALGEPGRDPDSVAYTLKGHYIVQNERLHPHLRRLVTWIGIACFWKIVYYPLNNAEREVRDTLSEKEKQKYSFPKMCTLDFALLRLFGFGPIDDAPKRYWFKVLMRYTAAIAPYVLVAHLLLPLLITVAASWVWGVDAGPIAFTVHANFILAEVLTNVHSFIAIVPNHTGSDLHVFSGACAGNSDDFFLRAVLGSVNYNSSGYVTDVLLGCLNFQVEHHSFPDLSMYSQRVIMPMVESVCRRHGIKYLKESVWVRALKTVEIIIGTDTQPLFVPAE